MGIHNPYCPPCHKCAWNSKPVDTSISETLIESTEYGCLKGAAAVVRMSDGSLGLKREETLHPLTTEGAEFFQKTNSPLATYC